MQGECGGNGVDDIVPKVPAVILRCTVLPVIEPAQGLPEADEEKKKRRKKNKKSS